MFYIAWEDFIQHYSSIDILYPDRSMQNMHISIREDDKCFGPVTGCLCGLSRYYCLCLGLFNLWFGESSAELKMKINPPQTGGGSLV